MNNDGLTPFLLACSLGNTHLFEELLQLLSVEFWTYSSITCCAYPLDSIDSLMMRNNSRQASALQIILQSNQSDQEQKAKLLSSEVMRKLLEEKWNVFARRQFMWRITFIMAYLSCMSVAIYLRRHHLDHDDDNTPASGHYYSHSHLHSSSSVRTARIVHK